MKVGSLFSGVGGFDLGLERAGFTIEWQVENNHYCREVLKKHWPAVPCHYDITTIDWGYIPRVDLLCGGPPCQPFSLVGKRLGASDLRNLWPETLQAVRAVCPQWIFFENVVGVEQYLAESILPELENAGYTNTPWGEIIPLDLPACAVGAPHIRQRVWIVAHTESLGRQQGDQDTGRHGEGAATKKKRTRSADDYRWPSPPSVCRVDVRIPDWSHRIRSIGNSIVPQIAEAIGRMILAVHNETRKERP